MGEGRDRQTDRQTDRQDREAAFETDRREEKSKDNVRKRGRTDVE